MSYQKMQMDRHKISWCAIRKIYKGVWIILSMEGLILIEKAVNIMAAYIGPLRTLSAFLVRWELL
jgi:hypothetical protein